MSLSSSPAPVANLDMVPPTWHRTGDWPDGRTKRLLRLRTSSVSMHQSLYDSQPDRLRYAHPWHFFPDAQPPSRTLRHCSFRVIASDAFSSSFALTVVRSFTSLFVLRLSFYDLVVCDAPDAFVQFSASDSLANHPSLRNHARPLSSGTTGTVFSTESLFHLLAFVNRNRLNAFAMLFAYMKSLRIALVICFGLGIRSSLLKCNVYMLRNVIRSSLLQCFAIGRPPTITTRYRLSI
jgi:hypothetical protein